MSCVTSLHESLSCSVIVTSVVRDLHLPRDCPFLPTLHSSTAPPPPLSLPHGFSFSQFAPPERPRIMTMGSEGERGGCNSSSVRLAGLGHPTKSSLACYVPSFQLKLRNRKCLVLVMKLFTIFRCDFNWDEVKRI